MEMSRLPPPPATTMVAFRAVITIAVTIIKSIIQVLWGIKGLYGYCLSSFYILNFYFYFYNPKVLFWDGK